VFNAVSSTGIVIVLIVYFLADLSRIRATLYRLVPHSRRPRTILIGDEIFAKIGAYVQGNLLTSLITGTATSIFLAIMKVPYALLLGIFVAIVDLLPTIGATLAGVGVCLAALSVSLPVGLATLAFSSSTSWPKTTYSHPRSSARRSKSPQESASNDHQLRFLVRSSIHVVMPAARHLYRYVTCDGASATLAPVTTTSAAARTRERAKSTVEPARNVPSTCPYVGGAYGLSRLITVSRNAAQRSHQKVSRPAVAQGRRVAWRGAG